MTKKLLISFAASAMILLSSCQEKNQTDMLVDNAIKVAKAHCDNMVKSMADKPNQLPKTIDANGKFLTSKIEWWCSGFFGGTLWYVYEATGDEATKASAQKYTQMLLPLIAGKTDHDIGFQFNSSYGNGYRLTGDEEYKKVMVSAAEKLAKRFDPNTGCIRSWDWDNKGKWQYPVIIDNMMNLELLEFGAKNSSDKNLANVARTHANTTLKNHFRPDNSSFHVVSYDKKTGVPHLKQTWQGLSDDSAWARGQTWGLYGYSMIYRESGDVKYLEHAEKIAKFLMNHKNMPEDKVPYWDMDAAAGEKTLRDASAAAIMASALFELSTQTKDKAFAKQCFDYAVDQIKSLCSPKYLAQVGTNCNFILMHSTGAIPFKSELDVPLSYADYYFMEALLRYKSLKSSSSKKAPFGNSL